MTGSSDTNTLHTKVIISVESQAASSRLNDIIRMDGSATILSPSGSNKPNGSAMQ